ncbi:MAG TPA: 50S ribosomal protein L9 [Candidatus Margulisiibacteriota bacterium]|nr:50S ribosomal protein L9 [Candidatus Margulisiibacteriota bacterium]
MEVILNRDVDKLGKSGSVVKVKEGYARNFLIPNGLAIPLTPGNLKKLEQEKEKKTLELEKSRKAAEALRDKLSGLSLTITALSQEEEKIYGSVTAQDIVSSLKDEGIEIDKENIMLDEPIKSLGIYEVSVKLHPEVEGKIKVWIVKK